MNGSNEAVPSFFFSVFLWSDANGLEDGRMASMKRTGLYERMDANRLGAVVGTGNRQVGANGRGGVVGVVNGLNGWYLSFILVFLLSEGARMGAVGGTVNGRVVANGLGGVVGAVNGLNGVVLIIFLLFFVGSDSNGLVVGRMASLNRVNGTWLCEHVQWATTLVGDAVVWS